jgi:chromosome partitioning protein
LPPHVVVIGNQKGGTGKSTIAMHIIVALLKAGKRVASFDLDLNQLTLTRFLGNRYEWAREHDRNLELPNHYSVTEKVPYGRAWKSWRAHKDDFIDSGALSHAADLRQFISQLTKIGRAQKHDFIVIDTPGSVPHLSLIAHGIADTLITPINDSLVDLDVLVAIEQRDLEPQPSVYAKMVLRALEARCKVSGRATDWIVVRNRLEPAESSNQRQITRALGVIRASLGFRIARGLLERPIYREFFAAGLTVFDRVEGLKSTAETNQPILVARLEVQNLIGEIGLIEDYADLEDEAFHEIEHLSRLCELALTNNSGPPDQELPMAGPPPAPPTAAPDIPPAVSVNIPSATGAPPLAPDAPAQENQSPVRPPETSPVHSPESGSSQLVGTTVMPDADESIMSAALVSMQDRQNRLTSLLHHLTVDRAEGRYSNRISAITRRLDIGAQAHIIETIINHVSGTREAELASPVPPSIDPVTGRAR